MYYNGWVPAPSPPLRPPPLCTPPLPHLVCDSGNLPNSRMWNIRSPPLMYSMTKKRWSLVWKQEWRPVRKGGFFCIANTFRSFRVHSTSSSWMIKSFFKLLMAYTSRVPLCSARNTCAWREGFEVVVSVENMAGGSFWLASYPGCLLALSTLHPKKIREEGLGTRLAFGDPNHQKQVSDVTKV